MLDKSARPEAPIEDTRSIAPEYQSLTFIGELASRVGVSPVTIRFYEKEGLITPGRVGRFRTYQSSDEQRLRAVLAMRGMGFPISRIRSTLAELGQNCLDSGSLRFRIILLAHFEELQDRKQLLDREISATTQALSKSAHVA
jgi:DNA-binding transcriptional MerR regulator